MKSKAWDILTQEEKSALSLSTNYGKSSWQAGEILNKAHYKYLEIQSRAKHFFRIFTIYFEETDNQLIPKDSDMTWDLQEFILCTLQNRMGYRETLKYIGKESPICHKKAMKRVEALKAYMDWLENHPNKIHQKLHDLILEFDRWNNFRILPEELQEPSAFKRRNKTRLLKHLRNLKELNPYHIDRLMNKFAASDKYKGKILYAPIVSDSFPNGYEVIPIQATSKIVNYLSSSLNLYMFKDKGEADDYGFLVEDYLSKKSKSCKQGQIFWPEFRLKIKKAANYDQVNNIIPRRSNLEDAFRDMDRLTIKRRKGVSTKDVADPTKRVNKTSFWDI